MGINADRLSDEQHVLGVDIGSVSVGLVVVTGEKKVVKRLYSFHHGDIAGTVERMLEKIDMQQIAAVAATDRTPALIDADFRCDDQVAVISAARHLHEKVGSVLQVGGETFAALFFDENGAYAGLKTNTSCAAGTGSFLDQQAGRLKLPGVAELAEIASKNTGGLPKIASRCAVFAKTDLIHAQQEGYRLPEICDGLCFGLAKNIVNTLFKQEKPNFPLIFCGGVAKNQAVISHIRDMIGEMPVADDMAPLYGAFGAAVRGIDEIGLPGGRTGDKGKILRKADAKRDYGHPPLELVQSTFPVFDANDAREYQSTRNGVSDRVEIDVYTEFEPEKRCLIYLGIDIGSTSTKAVWMTPEKKVLAGFYTRTAGRPVEAMCSLFQAMDELANRQSIRLEIMGAGTTGSGRKFVGAIAGADLVIDEITAHARAAVELNPDVDTIIEIGGQDAKFTTVKNGRVTFSIMNTVCAAGTGSFIEEQAEKLGVDLSDFAERTEKVASPIASDRCTVFMERDINYYLSCGYAINEVLAAVLHSVRENYMNKVAVVSSIGQSVCFQGATAKNRALVAAFEQRLNQPIHVSAFCHLTGALGVALHLADETLRRSRFRGLNLYKTDIPVRSEVCRLCTNHCKITIADMAEGPLAYGFLCGRDYDTKRFVDNNTSGFDLIREHRKCFPAKERPDAPSDVTVGIPSALYLHEDVSMWVDFFHRLGIRTVTGEATAADAVTTGKERVGAEFCAPMAAMHGQVTHMADRVDFVFLPHYLENTENEANGRRQYCYYSQYAPALIAGMDDRIADKLISPVIKYLYSNFYVHLEAYRAVRRMDKSISFIEIMRALEGAWRNREAAIKQWRTVFDINFIKADDICVMLLGRPYTVLDPGMNKKIPHLFGALGIKSFFQDMLSDREKSASAIGPFLSELHWNYAADIMAAAEIVSKIPGLYPVLMTSFNCSPDSFIRNVFQKRMESAGKPYLILEMDEHGSNVGYETRIESAVRSFRNHAEAAQDCQADSAKNGPARINPVKAGSMSGKTVIFPNWDPITCPLLVANLQREGVDTQLMTENEGAIRRSMRLNSGQCIPINAVAQEFVEHVQEKNLDPEQTLLWMAHAEIACNIRLYPYKLKEMIASFGGGMEKAGVYAGDIAFSDVSIKAARNCYFSYMFGGMLRKMGCRIRPYEKNPGETNRVIESSIRVFEDAFLERRDKEDAVIEVVKKFAAIKTHPGKRPEVAIFGDLYVRDNPVFNQGLIAFIETHGGEAITTPYTDYVKMIAPSYFKKWFTEGKYLSYLVNRALLATMVHQERTYYRHFQKVLKEPEPLYDVPAARILSEFGVIPENTGESMDNLLKIYYIKKFHPAVSLFVQTSPSFCCPSLVTEAMAGIIEERIGAPVVSLTYDGTGGDKNRKIIPFLAFSPDPREKGKKAVALTP